ncbi:MAG TPA: toxic anion resistance protein [Candidatus Lachnoclostridium avicola]|nr:toxic anion resistance protein [Candidatus Lachnoclostridium avicola]
MAQEISLETLAGAKAREALSGKTDGQPVVEDIQEEKLSPEQLARVEEIKNSIDLTDSQTALQYGVGAQRSIAGFADSILSQVRSKDSGYVGELMSDLVIKVKDVGVDKLNEDSFADKIPFFRTASRSLKKFMQRYEDLEVQIGRIEGELEKARMEMLKDVAMFDGLYEKNLEYFQELQIYIAAGEEKLKELREETIPRLREQAGQKGDPMSAQLVSDFEDTVNRFEKKVHDLKLSRTIAIQTAPQIRLIQNNDKLLVDKIQTAVLNTIPLWKSQIVIALGLHRQNKALKIQREVTDTTNRLLEKNSELLRQNTVETAREAERGIADLDTLKKVNSNLIATIEDAIKIQQEGRTARQNAETELISIEEKLKQTLLAVREQA